MFGIFMWIVFAVGIIGIIGVCIWDKKQTTYNHKRLNVSISVISVLLIAISVTGGIGYTKNKERHFNLNITIDSIITHKTDYYK